MEKAYYAGQDKDTDEKIAAGQFSIVYRLPETFVGEKKMAIHLANALLYNVSS